MVQPRKRCPNARDVLPEEVVKQIQKYYHGHMWVPPAVNAPNKRRANVLALYMQGRTQVDIARIVKLTPQRVWQIIAKERRKGLFSDNFNKG
jgi:hypothetical protein